MERKNIVEAFSAIAQETRLESLRLLLDRLEDGLPAGEVARLLGVPQNTMSAHLAVLKRADLVLAERQGTTILYRANTERVWQLVDYLVTDFAGLAATVGGEKIQTTIPRQGSNRQYNVLFLCTGNSARSVMAESVLNKDGGGRFRAFSAGNKPMGAIHPSAVAALKEFGYPTDDLRSKSWDEFGNADAPIMDFIFTLCDNAAGEVCPAWPGRPITAHWGIEDPSNVEVGFRQEAMFRQCLGLIKNRIAAFVSLPVGSIDRMSLRDKLRTIGCAEDAIGTGTKS